MKGGDRVTLRLRNGVLTHVTGAGPATAGPDVGITLDEATLRAVLLGTIPPDELGGRAGVEVTGDLGRLAELLGHLNSPDPDFALVTP